MNKLIIAPIIILFLLAPTSATTYGIITSSYTSEKTTTNAFATSIYTYTYYIASVTNAPPETTIYLTSGNTTQKTVITYIGTRVWQRGFFMETWKHIEKTKKIVIKFSYIPDATNTLTTYTFWTKSMSATYSYTTRQTNITLTGTGTENQYIEINGYEIVPPHTTTVHTIEFVTTNWTIEVSSISIHTITDTFFETQTITLFIHNTYGLDYTTYATIIEIITSDVRETYTYTSTFLSTYTNKSLTYYNMHYDTLVKTTNTTVTLTIIENGKTYTIAYGDFGTLTELTTNIYEKTIGKTTITTDFNAVFDNGVEVILDAYADNKYYSTSTLTIIYHDVNSFIVTPTTTTTTINHCFLMIKWKIIIHHNKHIFLMHFNDWYFELYF